MKVETNIMNLKCKSEKNIESWNTFSSKHAQQFPSCALRVTLVKFSSYQTDMTLLTDKYNLRKMCNCNFSNFSYLTNYIDIE